MVLGIDAPYSGIWTLNARPCKLGKLGGTKLRLYKGHLVEDPQLIARHYLKTPGCSVAYFIVFVLLVPGLLLSYPKAQHSPKALYNMVFGPKTSKIWSLES